MCRNVKEIVYAYDIFKTLREKWQAVYPVAAMTKDAYVYTQKFGEIREADAGDSATASRSISALFQRKVL